MPAGGQEITSGKTKGDREDQSFMDVLSIADSAAKSKAPEQKLTDRTAGNRETAKAPERTKVTDQTGENSNRDIAGKTSEKDDPGIKKTAESEQNTDNTSDTGTVTAIEDAAEDVKQIVEEKLGISDEELDQIMETLGLTMTDLLDPKVMADIVAQVKEVTPVDILTDDTLSGIVTDLQSSVRETTSSLIQEMDMTPEEFKNTLTALKNEYEVVSPTPETQENTEDFSAVLRDRGQKIQQSPEDTVRTPAEAVRTTEPEPDRTERISVEDKGSKEVSLNVTVKEGAQSSNTGGQNPDPSSDDILRSEGRAAHTEARAETTVNNNIFFQNLNAAVENTLEAAALGETTTPGSTMAEAMDIINQINSQIRAVVDSETQSLSMQLHPQSLGRLNVELVAKAGQLTAQFEAETASVKTALETHLVELKQSLEQRGIRVESVEVTVASHEFEQNLMGGEQSGAASQQPGGRPGRTRNINLNDPEIEEGVPGDIPEEEKIARDMMAANGNSVDYMA